MHKLFRLLNYGNYYLNRGPLLRTETYWLGSLFATNGYTASAAMEKVLMMCSIFFDRQ